MKEYSIESRRNGLLGLAMYPGCMMGDCEQEYFMATYKENGTKEE